MPKPLLTIFCLVCCLRSFAQISCDGSIIDSYWGAPLATSAGGPTPCSGSTARLNSLYATANDTSIFIGIGGIVQSGQQLVLFIDSKTGGSNKAIFNRTNAPTCLQSLPAATSFDPAFTPDYCLLIGYHSFTTTIRLFPLQITGTSSLISIADISTAGIAVAPGCSVGIAPSATDFAKGYEISLPRTLLEYVPGSQSAVRFIAMAMADDGNLGNQLLPHADGTATTCFGKGISNNGIQFPVETGVRPVEFNPSRSLPIDFINVKTFQIGQDIRVFWTSVSEKEMQAYEVERSADALQFKLLGTVAAKGNSTSQTNYSFTDSNPLPGKSFYRVKATDRNGRSTYSAVLKMQYGRVDNLLTIYPNPVKDQINLQMLGLKPDTYQLQIFNDMGQCLIEQRIVYAGGYGLQQIPLLPNMQKGPYRLLLRNKAFFYKQHFIVQ